MPKARRPRWFRINQEEIQSYLLHLFNSSHSPTKPLATADDFEVVNQPGIPWPDVSDDFLMPQVVAEHANLEESKKEILSRLKHFRYPYPAGNKSGRTFYDHLSRLGLVNLLIETPLLYDIRDVWKSKRYYELQVRARSEKLSQHDFPLEFHKKILLLLFDHLEQITCVAEEYAVPDAIWFREYHEAIQRQLLREGASYYPQFRKWFKPAHRITVRSFSVSRQVELFFNLCKSFAKRKVQNKRVAYQITALMCSSSDSIRKGKLDPDPEEVRKYVRDFERQNSGKKSGWTKPLRKPA